MVAVFKLAFFLFVTIWAAGCGGPGENTENPNDGSSAHQPTQVFVNATTLLMAESIMARKPGGYGDWNYETGTVLRGFEDLFNATGDSRYLDYIQKTVDEVVDDSGQISSYNENDYNVDEVKEGSLLLFLYEKTQDTRYKTAAEALREQLHNHPRTTDGGFWHKKRYPNQMWLDGLYMVQPFYAHYGKLFDEPAVYDDVLHQLTLMEKHAIDNQTGLMYHGWDESRERDWADAETGRSPEFWGRAIGWYLMALVDVLDFMPIDQLDHRQTIINILQSLVVAVEKHQDESGVWWQVVDNVGQSQNWQESSATAMYVYTIAKGINNGYLSATHKSTAIKGWEGLNKAFVSNNSDGTINLEDTCVGTSVGGSYSFYTGRSKKRNDPKGLGPYLMAGVAISRLSN